MNGTFASGGYPSTGAVSYDFVAGHQYVFTLYLGCTASVQIGNASNASAVASCNLLPHPSQNTLRAGWISFV